jgi:hypothetical protein
MCLIWQAELRAIAMTTKPVSPRTACRAEMRISKRPEFLQSLRRHHALTSLGLCTRRTIQHGPGRQDKHRKQQSPHAEARFGAPDNNAPLRNPTQTPANWTARRACESHGPWLSGRGLSSGGTQRRRQRAGTPNVLQDAPGRFRSAQADPFGFPDTRDTQKCDGQGPAPRT